ncbi:hypothetical protein ANDA3_1201 [plant metagenome]|uniref:Uncharacterized protein n=1 Tax=plant metagenome TaxID=1297885 RepID=A0A484SFT5_9ZZZZ
MTSSYYEATGVLVLDQVTPVITALFGGMKLDATYPGDGQAYIAFNYCESCAHWDTVCEELAAVATSLGLPIANEQTLPTIEQVLEALSRHFGGDQDEALANLIEHHSFDGLVDFDALFLIATRFDDGHGLKEIRMAGCWSNGKRRLFESGGDGFFLSRECKVSSGSSHAVYLGNNLRKALLLNNVEAAADVLAQEAQRLLAGVANKAQRRQLQQRLSERLRCLATT